MHTTALYFGSFNPLHNGHMTIAKYVLEHLNVNEFSFVLSPHSPMKDASIKYNSNERLANLNKVISRFSAKYNKENRKNCNINVCDIEFSLPEPLYTYNTLSALRDNFPDKKFIIIMGADNLNIIERWYKWRELISEYEIYVYPRSGVDGAELCRKYNVNYLNGDMINISSTEIRNGSIKNDLVL